jgi:hypothetical protein
MAAVIITLRQERGYLETNLDASSVIFPKSLRCQFERFYDHKKVRNKQLGIGTFSLCESKAPELENKSLIWQQTPAGLTHSSCIQPGIADVLPR